jgi:hypothetical protein
MVNNFLCDWMVDVWFPVGFELCHVAVFIECDNNLGQVCLCHKQLLLCLSYPHVCFVPLDSMTNPDHEMSFIVIWFDCSIYKT